MAEERGLLVDVEGFNKAMEEARERSRSAQNKVFQLSFFIYFLEECLMPNLRGYGGSLHSHYLLTNLFNVNFW